MDEPESAESEPAQRRVAVDVAAWVLVIALCLGAAALVAHLAGGVAAPTFRAAQTMLEDIWTQSGASGSCTVPLLDGEAYAALIASDPPGPKGERTPPRWLERPRPRFPHAMRRAALDEGAVRLTCRFSSEGQIRACRLIEETRPGLGMAQAAVASFCDARVQPLLIDGHPHPGSMTVTINFRMMG